MATATARTKNKKQDEVVCATCPQNESPTCDFHCPEPETEGQGEPEVDACPGNCDECVPDTMPATPEKPAAPESDDHALLEEIRAANRECDTLFLAMDLAKAQLKEAKAEYEGAVANLRGLISAQSEQLPLFDKANRDKGGEPFPVAAEEWRGTPIDTLGLAPGIVKALDDAGIENMGALADWTKVSDLTDIPGIGETKAEAIKKADVAFWKTHAEAEVTEEEADADVAGEESDEDDLDEDEDE